MMEFGCEQTMAIHKYCHCFKTRNKKSYNKINKKLLRGCPIFVKTIFKFGLMMVAGLKYDIGR